MNYKLLLTTLLLAATSGAQAENVLRRSNDAEPASMDPQLAQGMPEMHILRDMFVGLIDEDAGAHLIPGVAENGKSPQTAKLTPSTCATTPNGATAPRSPHTTSSMAGSARLIPRPVANTASSSTRSKTRKKSPKATKKT